MKDLEPAVRGFVESLRRNFAGELVRDPREFKKRVLRLIRRELPLKKGRPPSPEIEAALTMLRQGKSVRDVLRAQISGFDEFDVYGRYLAEKAFRQALVRRGWRTSEAVQSRQIEPAN